MPVHLGHQMADMDRDHGDRRAARPGRDRGLRTRARPAVAGPGRRLHRRLRLVQPPVLEDPDRRRRRLAAHERRRRSPAAPTRSSTAAARRIRTRRSSRSAPTTGWASCTRRSWSSRWSGSPRSRRARATQASWFEAMVARDPGRPGDAGATTRITRWSFYNYILAIDPDAFAGRTNEDRLRGDGGRGHPGRGAVPVDEPLRALPALPVAAAGLRGVRRSARPQRMSFPVAEAAGQRESVYFMENVVPRRRRKGIEDAVEAVAKVQRHADELPKG